ncbi:MAG: type II toxin-antitoxin system VapC family toxin [Alphaproteobacteria bacterium]|nr:type II toxin-antitoxin system VapC family toxin [Alphaproteobacteria bacterium]
MVSARDAPLPLPVVLDTSALAAYLRHEQGHEAVEGVLEGALVCTANIAEVIGVLMRRGVNAAKARQTVADLAIVSVPFDLELALRAGEMEAPTRSTGLSLGDRACLALAELRGAEAWTADRRWLDAQLPIRIRLIR